MALKISRRTAVLAFALLASCSASGQHNQTSLGKSMENASISKLSITSDAFRDGGAIPVQYTCDGAGETPELHWGEPPQGTGSFALVIDDPDAPSGTFRHWGVFDIPASARSIGGAQKTGTEVKNDFGKPGYGGPCPPKGNGAHHYHFKLFALNVGELGVSPEARVADIEKAAQRHVVAKGELVGTYERR